MGTVSELGSASSTVYQIFNKDRFSLENVELVSPAFVALSKLTLPITLIGGIAAILIPYGTPIGAGKITNELQRYIFACDEVAEILDNQRGIRVQQYRDKQN